MHKHKASWRYVCVWERVIGTGKRNTTLRYEERTFYGGYIECIILRFFFSRFMFFFSLILPVRSCEICECDAGGKLFRFLSFGARCANERKIPTTYFIINTIRMNVIAFAIQLVFGNWHTNPEHVSHFTTKLDNL